MAPTTTTAGRARGGDRSGWAAALRPRLGTLLAVGMLAALLAVPPSLPVGDQLPAASHAAGVLDPTFDTDGIATTEIMSDVAVVDSAVEVVDGTERLLVLDRSERLWRFLPDGRLDTSFDDDGVLPLRPELDEDLTELAVDPRGGSLVVAGYDFFDDEITVARFTTTGTSASLDESFGSGGTALIVGGATPDTGCGELDRTILGLTDLGIQSSGSVVVVGPGTMEEPTGEFCTIVTRQVVVAARTAPDGDGAPTVVYDESPFGGNPSPGGLSVIAAGDHVDHVVVSVSATSDTTDHLTALRYEPDLAQDTGFSSNGWADEQEHDHTFDLFDDEIPLVARDDGRVDLAFQSPSGTGWHLLRWDSSGVFLSRTVTGFDETIALTTPDGLEVTADGGLVATGYATFPGGSAPPPALTVAVYSEGGTITDTEILHHPGPPPAAHSRLRGRGHLERLGADGAFLVADAVRRPTIATSQQLRLTRLDADGQVDPPPTADADGFVTHHGARRVSTEGLRWGESARTVAVLPDGRIATGGHIDDIGISEGTTPSGFLLRHGSSGPLDPGFSPSPLTGILVPGFDTSEPGVVEGLALDPAGRTVVAGWAGFSDSVGVLNRVFTDGSADPSFNPGAAEPDAPVIIDLDDAATALHDVVVDTRGRIVVVGESMRSTSSETSVEDIVVVRLLEDGELDPEFGSPSEPGVARIPPPDGTGSWRAGGRAVALDPTGRIVITGWIQPDPESPDTREVITARFDADGAADATFGSDPGLGDGVRLGPDGTGQDVASDGSTIVVAGRSESVGFLARRTASGGLDPDFGGGGTVSPFSTEDFPLSTASSVRLDAVGNYVVAGRGLFVAGVGAPPPPATFVPEDSDLDDFNLESDLVLARVLSSGDLDTVFGNDGMTTTDLGLAAHERAYDVAIAPDGKIVAAGEVSDDRSTRVLVARYLPGESTLECTPATVDLGIVEIGDSASATATCTAVGGTVVIGDPVVSPDPTSANPFALPADACQDATLFPGESCDLTVAMTPLRSGTTSGTLEVAHQTVTGPATVTIGLQATTPGPSLVLDPTEGPIETAVEATGADFDIGVDVELSIGGTAVASVPAEDLTEGGFTTTFEVPVGTPGGPQPVTACQRCGTAEEVAATATFRVTPRLFVTPSVARPGEVVSARGDGFPAGATVFLDWEPGLGRIAVTADGDGTFTDVAVLVFRRDLLGPRELEAFIGGASEAAASAPLLAVPGSSQPSNFATRR